MNPRPVFEATEGGDEVVITSRGKPVALLVGVEGDNLEETIRFIRTAKAQAAASRMRKAATQQRLDAMSQNEIAEEIEAVRRERTGQ